MFSNRFYDIAKWVCIVFIPALMTFYGVLGSALNIPHTDLVLTIAGAFDTFLGSLLGISSVKYKKESANEDTTKE